MSESTDELQQMILHLHRESQKMVLKLIMKKNMMMFNIRHHEIEIYDEIVDVSKITFTYNKKIAACRDRKEKKKIKGIV